jgi:hypothetical protein
MATTNMYCKIYDRDTFRNLKKSMGAKFAGKEKLDFSEATILHK